MPYSLADILKKLETVDTNKLKHVGQMMMGMGGLEAMMVMKDGSETDEHEVLSEVRECAAIASSIVLAAVREELIRRGEYNENPVNLLQKLMSGLTKPKKKVKKKPKFTLDLDRLTKPSEN
jgi:hypothetical protein